jgi:hypothetical protein
VTTVIGAVVPAVHVSVLSPTDKFRFPSGLEPRIVRLRQGFSPVLVLSDGEGVAMKIQRDSRLEGDRSDAREFLEIANVLEVGLPNDYRISLPQARAFHRSACL